MTLRIFAGIIIIIGCGTLGMFLSGKFKGRVRQLELLQNAMTQLEFDIDFLNVTLDESFARMAKNTEGPLKEVFLYVSERLKNSPGSDMQQLWKRAISKYRYDLALNNEDTQIVVDFAKSLGEGNREKEKNNIRLAEMRLKMALEEARFEAEKNIKMYRGLGFLAGVFIVIVLL